ncbi:MAG: hypothetical protein ABJO09_15040 [Hyphomicrobiales bacterium]
MTLNTNTQSECRTSIKKTSLAAVSTLFAAMMFGGGSAVAQDDIYTTYAPEKNGCTAADTLISFAKDSVSGPGFSCVLSNPSPAGSGLVNYDGACLIGTEKISDFVTFDLGNYPDRFEVSIPKRGDWLPMYPCTPVAQLKK